MTDQNILNNEPLVSVGIPTFNRPEGLRKTLECITNQTYKNLEIIVSDNCSPGNETENVVKEFMKKDPRIHYYRQETNKGMTYNFNFVLEKSSGEYFMWAADDDEWDSNYILKCVNILNKYPDVVLCTSHSALINSKREIIRLYSENCNTIGLSKIERLKKTILEIIQNTTFYGLRRIDITKRLLIQNKYGYDHVHMMQLSYFGSIAVIPEVLFFCNIEGIGSSSNKIVQETGDNSFLIKISPPLSIMKSFFEEIFTTSHLTTREKCIVSLFVIMRYIKSPYRNEILRDILNLLFKK